MAQEIFQADDIMKERKRTYEQANGQIDLYGMIRANSEVLNDQAAKVARLNELDNVHANIVQLVNSNKAICASFEALQQSMVKNNSSTTAKLSDLSSTIKTFTDQSATRESVITNLQSKIDAQDDDLTTKSKKLESVEAKISENAETVFKNQETVDKTIHKLEEKISSLEEQLEAQKSRGWFSSIRGLFTWRKKTTVVVEPAVDQTVEDPPVEPAVDQTVEDPPVEPDEVTLTEENVDQAENIDEQTDAAADNADNVTQDVSEEGTTKTDDVNESP